MPLTISPATWGLAAAIEAGTAEPIEWIDVACPALDLTFTVPKLPLGISVNGRLLRVSLTYAEQVRICRTLGCVSPTYEWYTEIWRAAPVKLTPRPLVRTAADALAMGGFRFLCVENAAFDAQLAAHADELAIPGAFARGFCKVWLVGPLMQALGKHGTVNAGFKYPDGHELQHPWGRHNDMHLDYSQWAWDLPKRFARRNDGTEVDLLELQCMQLPSLATRLRNEYGP